MNWTSIPRKWKLRFDPLSFLDRDVPVDWRILNPLHPDARLRPGDLYPIDFLRFPGTQHFPRIATRQITSTAISQPRSDHPSGRPSDLGANRVAIAAHAIQLQAEPMIARAGLVPQQDRRPAIRRDQDIDKAIVVEIADGQPAGGIRFAKDRAAFAAYVSRAATTRET